RSDQVVLDQDLMPEFKGRNAQLIGISVDSDWCHLASPGTASSAFRCWPTSSRKGRRPGSITRTVVASCSERPLFVIDTEGSICWSRVSPVGVNPGAEGILRAPESMEAREGAS